MLLGLSSGAGDAATEDGLGGNPGPSLPRKPIAGRCSLLISKIVSKGARENCKNKVKQEKKGLQTCV